MVAVFIWSQEGGGSKIGRWDGNLAPGNRQSHSCSRTVIGSFEYQTLHTYLLLVRKHKHESTFALQQQ